MKIVLLFMSKQFSKGVAHRPALLERPKPAGTMPGKIKTWSGAILAGLARRGHDSTFLCLEREDYIRARLGDDPAFYPVEPRFDAVWTSRADLARRYVEAADAILVRGLFGGYAKIFAGMRLGDRPVVMFSVVTGFASGYWPAAANLTLLMSSSDECAEAAGLELRGEIFRKPAYDLFYERPPIAPRKVYDAAFVTWETATPRKRFGLVLDALAHMKAHSDRRFSLVVAGDAAAHAERIESEFRPPARVEVHRAGRLGREQLRDLFWRSRLTVVASDIDPNPQVIAESLACDVPVACAADITGGAFQINRQTGELFDPTPEAMATTMTSMLERLDTYRPRAHCITVDDAVDQIEALVTSSQPPRR